MPHVDPHQFDSLKHEAEFYGISPLLKRLEMCCDLLSKDACGDVVFQAHLKTSGPPSGASSSRPSSDSKWNNPVTQILAHHNAIAVSYRHYVTCYRLKDSLGWQKIYESERIPKVINGIAFCYNCCGVGSGASGASGAKFMLGLALEKDQGHIRLWSVSLTSGGVGGIEAAKSEVGKFPLSSTHINALFFIGSQMVALGYDQGRVGVWHATSAHWLVQGLGTRRQQHQAITAYDKAGCNFLLLGSKFGSIFLIDMQKFPLRMKDGDLLINELYEDPDGEEITAISCYLTRTPKTSGNWIEIAYGTRGGTVRVLVQHPETVGQGPQLFQTFKVHLDGINSVMLSEKYLISTCSKMHVRTWTLTRFRGRISTQPGSTPHASFRLMKLDENSFDRIIRDENGEEASVIPRPTPVIRDNPGVSICPACVGPFGDQDDVEGRQVFVEKLKSSTDRVSIILASNGERICTLKSVDGSLVSTYCVHECEAVAMGNRSRRYILTGHNNGHIQVWDLSTGFEMMFPPKESVPSSVRHNPTLTMNQLLKELL